MPGRQDEFAHFDPGAGIDEFGETFALGQLALGVAPVDPCFSVFVLASGEVVEQLLQVGSDVVEVDL